MKIKLAYGKNGLEIDLPENADVTLIESRFVGGLPDSQAALSHALQNPIDGAPLTHLADASNSVAIIFSDITRPTPNHLILPAVLVELQHVPDDQITLFNALGTHRENTRDELAAMLGADIVERFRIVQNNAFDQDTQVSLGKTSWGHEVWINRELMETDVKILTGFIEPHFFAGFSGGGKAIMPGMAGQGTVLGNHDAGMIGDSRSTWGITDGNPIFEEARAAALLAKPDFLLNVTLNSAKEITGVFAGSLAAAHDAGIAFARENAMTSIEQPFDIVITTNSGYPLDMNLYQAVKGMSAAEQVIKDGGTIIVAAECSDGIPDHGLYGQLLREADSPKALFDGIVNATQTRQDQWQAQIQARIQLKADVYVYSDYLSDDQISDALLKPCRDIPALLAQHPGARIGIIPDGPQTIPYIEPVAVKA
jgi:nickel-dependent lactate racemase